MEEVKVFGTKNSAFAHRVVWALKLKGIEFEFIEEDLANKSALLLKYNPIHKKVPVFVHGGKPIVESMIIVEYIEETWPENPLLPKDAYERSVARFWIKFADDKGPTIWSFFLVVEDKQEQAVKEGWEVLKTIEEYGLGDKKFFGGDAIGIVDIAFGLLTYLVDAMEDVVGLKLMEDHMFPRLHAWRKNFKEVPVIKDTLPDHDGLCAYLKHGREMYFASQQT